MGLRRQHGRLRQRDHRPAGIERLRDVLNKRLRRAGDQRQFYVFPIFADGVVHNGPALQQRLVARLLGQDDAVCALPYGDLADVAHENIAVAAARSGNRHASQITRAG